VWCPASNQQQFLQLVLIFWHPTNWYSDLPFGIALTCITLTEVFAPDITLPQAGQERSLLGYGQSVFTLEGRESVELFQFRDRHGHVVVVDSYALVRVLRVLNRHTARTILRRLHGRNRSGPEV